MPPAECFSPVVLAGGILFFRLLVLYILKTKFKACFSLSFFLGKINFCFKMNLMNSCLAKTNNFWVHDPSLSPQDYGD